ncbi:hypothetical protein ACMYSQ_004411 [Aspergillus niger]
MQAPPLSPRYSTLGMTGLKETFAIDISNRIALTGPSIDTNTSFASHERNRLGDGGLWAESRLEKQKQAPIIVKGPVEISLLDPPPSRLPSFFSPVTIDCGKF